MTDVYFLMNETQLANFEGWWDGIYRDEHNPGGTEFNGSRREGHNPENGTHCHVPRGMLEAYQASGEFDEWLLDEDSNCYPLWWIVNYGVVGREYTVKDALTAVYVDKKGGLYAKDDNHWLTPDRAYPGEIDYMKNTGLMDEHEGKRYDQSNWVVLTNVEDPDDFIGYLINGETISGILKDKMNPVIEVSDGATLEIGDQGLYEKNVYIPASFMGRAQLSPNGRVYALVQPKPQELIRVDWTIYSEKEECFYLPEPDEDNGINTMKLKGGFGVSYDLYKGEVPALEDCGYYAFDAINRRTIFSDNKNLLRSQEAKYTPYTSGGVSDKFIVYPLELPADAPLTGVVDVVIDFTQINKGWFTIDGRSLGDTKPTTPGFYINGNRKIIIR